MSRGYLIALTNMFRGCLIVQRYTHSQKHRSRWYLIALPKMSGTSPECYVTPPPPANAHAQCAYEHRRAHNKRADVSYGLLVDATHGSSRLACELARHVCCHIVRLAIGSCNMHLLVDAAMQDTSANIDARPLDCQKASTCLDRSLPEGCIHEQSIVSWLLRA